MLASRAPRSFGYPVIVFAALVTAAACRDRSPSAPEPPANLAAASSQTQSAVVGTAVAGRPAVKVTDASGRPVSGVPVTFSVTSGAGTVQGSDESTNVLGSATVGAWTLGTRAGANTLRASVDGLDPIVFTATGTPGPAASIAHAGGAGQTAPAGTALPEHLSVRVQDEYENGIEGVVVSWEPTGGGIVIPTSATSDATGIASAEWVLRPVSGTDTVVASSGSLEGSPLRLLATATPNGTIAGLVVLTSSSRSLAPARAAADRTTVRIAERTSVHPKVMDGASRVGIRVEAARGIPGASLSAGAEYAPDALIVTMRASAIGAPEPGARALHAIGTSREVARRMRNALEPMARALGAAFTGTSPVLLSSRIRVEPHRMEEARARLLENPAVLSVERDPLAYSTRPAVPEVMRRSLPVRPNDPLYVGQAWHYGMIDLPDAWNIATGSNAVLVAVVDDGIRFDHPSVAGNLASDGYDFVSSVSVDICGSPGENAGDGDGYDPDPTVPARYDCSTGGLSTSSGHGLHVAGTIGAVGNDGFALTGVNWNVSIRPVRALGVTGSGSLYDIAQAVLYAAGLPADDGNGGQVQAPTPARIINMSLGGSSPSTTLQNAIIAASNAGVLLVASAGNRPSTDLNYPAAYPEVMSVSAVGPDGTLASYSSFGSTIDIAAPGGDVALGGFDFAVLSAHWNFVDGAPVAGFSQGTSMAAPHVSGVAALLLAQEPSLTVSQLRSRLTDYAVDVGPAGPDIQYGAGVVNARNSLTQTHAPERAVHAALYDELTGVRLSVQPATSAGGFSFGALENGSYYVFAGEDHEGDGLIGLPGRRWGAFGNATVAPSAVSVTGAGTQNVEITAGRPYESEPNESMSLANRLVVGGVVDADLSSDSDADFYAITVPAGEYTFETSARLGACGLAREADTILELLDAEGASIQENDDIAGDDLDFCSRIVRFLGAGTYFIRVTGFGAGYYRLQVR